MYVSYFDTAFTDEPVKLTPVDAGFLAELNQAQFKGFSYTNKQYTSWPAVIKCDNTQTELFSLNTDHAINVLAAFITTSETVRVWVSVSV